MTKDDKSNPFKIVLVGDSGTGKSSLLSRLINDEIDFKCTSTTGLVNEIYHLLIDNKMVEIDICDIGGHDVTKSYFHDANGILLVFDISNPASFENITDWLEDIIDHTDPKTVIRLIGNKNDLNDQRAVPIDKIVSFTSKYGLSFTEMSAFDADNRIRKLFQEFYVTIYSVLDSSDNDDPFSTCGFISTCMENKDHVEIPIPDSSHENSQPQEQQEQQQASFYIVLVDTKKASDDWDPIIQCVEKQLYEDDLKYVAISYRWGELQETLTNTGVGYKAKITSFDLKHFYRLCRMMRKEKDMQHINYVWVDAICVDQSNDERRKATIYQMSNIYERAEYMLAVPDLHKAHLENTSTTYEKIMKGSKAYRGDLYHLIHNNIHQLTDIENKWLNEYNVPNEPRLRELLRLSTDHFTNGFINYRTYHRSYNPEESLDHIYETSQQPPPPPSPEDNNDNISDEELQQLNPMERPMDRFIHQRHRHRHRHQQQHHHNCHQRNCPVDLFHNSQQLEWRRSLIYNSRYDDEYVPPWKYLIQQRSDTIRRSMNFMKDLIKDWSSRVWVISEYSIAKKKNNMKYWFIQLDFAYDKDATELVFFNFDFEDDVFSKTIRHALIDYVHDGDNYYYPSNGDGDYYYYPSNDPVYLTFHETMITHLNQQSFFEMMLKSKASKNVDRFYSIFPLTNYKNILTDKTKMGNWKIDSLSTAKLKLYQVMNTKDKLNLLFISGSPMTDNLGEVAPTFATSPINWDKPMEHFTFAETMKSSDYNFDLDNNSSITLVESISDNLPQFYLNIKPRECYVAITRPTLASKINTALWNELQSDQDPFETHYNVCIPSIKQEAMLAYERENYLDRSKLNDHVIYLVGNFEKNIWTMTRGYSLLNPIYDDHGLKPLGFVFRTCDDDSDGFNIY